MSLNILSGGAAQGLVRSLEPAFEAETGLGIAGEFGAVGAMAARLRAGVPTDIVILTAALIAKLADEGLVLRGSITDIGRVETALAVPARDPLVSADDAASLRTALLAADAIFVPDTNASTAGIHVAKLLAQIDIADVVADRLRVFPNGATAMRYLAESNDGGRSAARNRPRSSAPKASCCPAPGRQDAGSPPCTQLPSPHMHRRDRRRNA